MRIGFSNPERHAQNVLAGDITLTDAEARQVWDIVDRFEVRGDRYFGGDPGAMRLWG